MDITATFLPVAKELIDQVFPTGIRYIKNSGGSYDPATGDVVVNSTQFDLNAGVLARALEEGGVAKARNCVFGYTMALAACLICRQATKWIQRSGVEGRGDRSTYSSGRAVASKITARAD